jgi:hypothetical protein
VGQPSDAVRETRRRLVASAPAPWWAVIGMFVASISLAVATNILSVRAETRARVDADRQWCDLIELDNQTYRVEPPTTPSGKRRAAIYASLAATRCS